MLVPSTTIALPNPAKQLIVERTRTASIPSPNEPLNFGTLTETVTLKNESGVGLPYVTTVTRNANPQTIVFTTPESRSFKAELDSYGRVTTLALNKTTPVVAGLSLGYDTAGHLNTITQSNRQVTATWSGDFISGLAAGTVGNPQMYHVGTAFDGRGELKTITRNDTRQIILDYDKASNLTLLQRPGESGPVSHSFTPNNVDLLATYDAPDVSGSTPGVTSYTWDKERRLDSVTWPDSSGVDLEYFAPGTAEAGKLHYLKTLPAQGGTPLSTYAYYPITDPDSGHLSTISTLQNVTTSLGWNGLALTSLTTTWPNAMSKTAEFVVDDYLRVTGETATGGSTVTYSYDKDGLITHAIVTGADLTLTRNDQTGWVDSNFVQSSRQTITRTPTYGQLSSVTTRTNAFLNNLVHTLSITGYDDLGRITDKTDRVLTGTATIRDYSYDAVGRLTGDGTTTWGYDYNGNRTTVNGGAPIATYDDQDRILSYNGTTYTHNANGDRASKTYGMLTTNYGYDSFHNLKSVRLATSTIAYDIDGLGRRVGRRKIVSFSTVSDRRYLLGEGNRVLAEYNVDSNNNVTLVSRFVYATHSHVPDYMIQGSNIYRFVTDQLGSVRLLVNVNVTSPSAAIVKQINYDAWGNITSETGTIDQPFGFAGGLQDRDTGLVHFGAREYDPVTGRWLQKDPIRFRGGDTNLYAYAGNDPVNRIDPTGLITLGLGIQFQVGAAGTVSVSLMLVKDDAGNRAFSVSVGGGGMLGSGACGVFQGQWSNAASIFDLAGWGGAAGGSVDFVPIPGAVAGAEGMFGAGYEGVSFGAGPGVAGPLPAPVELHGEATYTWLFPF